jgi:hypothetical protein
VKHQRFSPSLALFYSYLNIRVQSIDLSKVILSAAIGPVVSVTHRVRARAATAIAFEARNDKVAAPRWDNL